MPDYNKLLTPGNIDEGWINAIVDIPEGSSLKIEYDRQHGIFMLDRVEPAIFPKPVNYGFIPGTKDADGDELDVLLYCHEPIPTGVLVVSKIIGILNFEDDREMDYKIVCVPADDRNTGDSINTLDDLGKRISFCSLQRFQKAGNNKGTRMGRCYRSKEDYPRMY